MRTPAQELSTLQRCAIRPGFCIQARETGSHSGAQLRVLYTFAYRSGSSPAAVRRATCSTPTDVLLIWDDNAWQDYLWWQQQDRKILKRINLLLQDITRNGNEGIGKPEPLKYDFAGYWSRRITDEHRLVYKVTDTEVRIATCRYHYG